jgi:hypothetical protein
MMTAGNNCKKFQVNYSLNFLNLLFTDDIHGL